MIAQIQSDWKAVGIEAKVQTVTRLEAETAFTSNEFDVAVWGGDGGFEAILEPRYYFPFSVWSLYAPLWAKWFIDPTDPKAEEPPAAVKEQMTLYGQLQATTDSDKQIAIMAEIINISKKQFYVIGLNRPAVSYGVVKNNFHNVPSSMPTSYSYPEPGPTNPAQYYIDPQP
jgi:peptide/nickel transport system substrate-binding protein